MDINDSINQVQSLKCRNKKVISVTLIVVWFVGCLSIAESADLLC